MEFPARIEIENINPCVEVSTARARRINMTPKARNLAKAMHVLSGKPGRFMVRSWKDGK
jgi:hypothetical protein